MREQEHKQCSTEDPEIVDYTACTKNSHFVHRLYKVFLDLVLDPKCSLGLSRDFITG